MKPSKYPLAQAPGLPFAHDISSLVAACAYSWLKLTCKVNVKTLDIKGLSGTHLELVRLLQEANDRLGEFFDISLPVVTNILAGSERELEGV